MKLKERLAIYNTVHLIEILREIRACQPNLIGISRIKFLEYRQIFIDIHFALKIYKYTKWRFRCPSHMVYHTLSYGIKKVIQETFSFPQLPTEISLGTNYKTHNNFSFAQNANDVGLQTFRPRRCVGRAMRL